MDMFCYQCEQTAKGSGCTVQGVCGKDAQTAALQDLLIHACEGIGMYAHRAGKLGKRDHEIDVFVTESLFVTLTNVNFDAADICRRLSLAGQMRDKARTLYESASKQTGQTPESLDGPARWTASGDIDQMVKLGRDVTIQKRIDELGADVAGLQELLTYGLKGMSAYAYHAEILGQEDDSIYAFFHETLDYLAGNPTDIADLTARCLKCGQMNLAVMELLDKANTGRYGHPVPTAVRITPVAGKAIAISGHDLKDLEELLKQTEGKGINIYTHGEMLPAHGYPELKKYKHLVGNYGGAWQDQHGEFDAFPGAILMTTNCLRKPRDSYKDRIFTSGPTGFSDVMHISGYDFTPVIQAALAADGFGADEPEKTITVGFGHNAVMAVADKVIAAVKSGAIKHFFLIGGCDGAKSGRNYFTDLAQAVPNDCVILTLACGKYRFNKLDFGSIGGIPRLLDVGQCNDAYSAVQIASALAKAFETDVNGLPLSMFISWYEQKAVAILLTLLSLGIKNIKLGPTLPAFVSPNVLDVLVKQFNIGPTTTVQDDLAQVLQYSV